MSLVVLVHGGATTSRYWDLVLPHLEHPALAVDLPGRLDRPADLATLTVAEAAASVVRDIGAAVAEGDDLVLVAHSSGGLEVPEIVAGVGAARVRAIVLNAASVPPEGGNGFDCMQQRHAEAARAALAAADEQGTAIITPLPRPDAMRRSSGEELTDEQHAFACDPVRCVEDSFNLYRHPVRWSQAAGIPVTYVVNLRDRAIPADLQREMAARLPDPPTIVELDCGHLPAVTRPEAFARIVDEVARRAR
jgi:pimeloyl-ACP methyl ester carboxylesterase